MAIAAGVNKQVRIKKEATFGTAPGATGAVQLRRVESTLDLAKNTYQAEEIVSDYQVSDFRHGSRRVEGAINGELSPGTYQLLMAAALRKDFVAGATSGALTTVTAAAGPPGTFTRSAGSFINDGIKQGDIGRWTGWTTTGAANNARNYRVTDLTATVLTTSGLLDEVVAAKAAGDSVTFTVTGKKTWTPLTGHTNDSFSVEHWFSDIAQSELFRGCKVQSMEIALPATGLARSNFTFLGKDITTGVAEYYTTPTAAPTTGIAAAVNGVVRLQSVDVAVLTGISFTYQGGMTGLEVVGATSTPDIFPGRVQISGQLTAAFENATLRDYFINETEVDLQVYLKLTSAINTDFLSFYFGRLKVGGAAKNDGEQGLIATMPFTALRDTTGAATKKEQTSLSIQDSTL
jgi:hypothetical protein